MFPYLYSVLHCGRDRFQILFPYLYSGWERGVSVWQLETGETIWWWKVHRNPILNCKNGGRRGIFTWDPKSVQNAISAKTVKSEWCLRYLLVIKCTQIITSRTTSMTHHNLLFAFISLCNNLQVIATVKKTRHFMTFCHLLYSLVITRVTFMIWIHQNTDKTV